MALIRVSKDSGPSLDVRAMMTFHWGGATNNNMFLTMFDAEVSETYSDIFSSSSAGGGGAYATAFDLENFKYEYAATGVASITVKQDYDLYTPSGTSLTFVQHLAAGASYSLIAANHVLVFK